MSCCSQKNVKGNLCVCGNAKVSGNMKICGCLSTKGLVLAPQEANPCGENSLWTDGECLNFTDGDSNTTCLNPKPLVDDAIIGWWTDTFRNVDNSVLQLVNFYYDQDRNIRAHYYAGWANQYREYTPEDFTQFFLFQGSNDVPVKPVIGTAGPGYILNYQENPPVELSLNLFYSYTARIQDDGTLFVETLDNDRLGGVTAYVSRYYRLDMSNPLKFSPNLILPYEDPSNVDSTDPVNIFNWSVDFLLHKLAQLNVHINPNDYPGFLNSKAYAAQIRDDSVSYNSTVKDVWTTRFPIAYFPTNNNQPLTTTIVTQNWHGVRRFARVKIDGFTGAYAVLNGSWTTSVVENRIPRDIMNVYNTSHVNDSTLKHIFNIDYDSRALPKYNPEEHGVANVTALYGPVKHNTEYYDLLGALAEFVNKITLGTHTQTLAFIDTTLPIWKLPQTFQEVKDFLNLGIFAQIGVPSRGSNYTRYNNFYLNARNGRSSTFGPIPANDPTGMYLGDAKFAYSIVRQNYLNPAKTYSVYWGIDGPIIPSIPITGALTSFGYKNNGSNFVFTTENYYAPNPNPAFWSLVSVTKDSLIGGIIDNPAILQSIGETSPVAYIYLNFMEGADVNLLYLAATVEFTPEPYPFFYWNFVKQFASLMAKLQESNPKKYIIDIRGSPGGTGSYVPALLSFFGDDRPFLVNVAEYADNGNKKPLTAYELRNMYKDVNNGLTAITTYIPTVQTNLTASVYPNLMVRGEEYEVHCITSLNTFSGADTVPHLFIAGLDGRDLGYGVKSKIIGEIDGRIHGGASSPSGLYVNTSHNLKLFDMIPLTAVNYTWETLVNYKRSGQAPYDYYFSNQNALTAPDVLLNGDIDSTIHLDTGYITPYPLAVVDGGTDPNILPLSSGKGQPDQNNNTTWRDIILEASLTN